MIRSPGVPGLIAMTGYPKAARDFAAPPTGRSNAERPGLLATHVKLVGFTS
jgi:hypothetical protein